jgi:hypothetical protein
MIYLYNYAVSPGKPDAHREVLDKLYNYTPDGTVVMKKRPDFSMGCFFRLLVFIP